MNSFDGYLQYLITKQNTTGTIATKIEKAYAKINYEITLDPHDQIHFASILFHAIQYFRPSRVIQTGTCSGVSLVAMLIASSDSGIPIKITTIDPEPESYFNIHKPVKIARSVVSACGFENNVSFLKGYSGPAPVGESLPSNLISSLPQQFDMLVIDGDHSFQGAYNDLKEGFKVLGNFFAPVFVHDYNSIPEVRAAVDLWVHRSECVLRTVRTVHPSGLAIIQIFNKKKE